MAQVVMSEPCQAVLHTLANADGSATYIAPNRSYQIVAGVNYPVEVPYRSDEIPESTYIEVNLRPHNGVGMVKERHVEELVKRTLETIILGEETPRAMLQITLQVVSVAADESLPGGVKDGGQGETDEMHCWGCPGRIRQRWTAHPRSRSCAAKDMCQLACLWLQQ